MPENKIEVGQVVFFKEYGLGKLANAALDAHASLIGWGPFTVYRVLDKDTVTISALNGIEVVVPVRWVETSA